MKIQILSDLHIDIGFFQTLPEWEEIIETGKKADLCIVAGDIANSRELGYQWLCEYLEQVNLSSEDSKDSKVAKATEAISATKVTTVTNVTKIILILGNHDFYGSSIAETFEFWYSREKVKSREIVLLENQCINIKDIIFFGCTFWTDLNGASEKQLNIAQKSINDWKQIKDFKPIDSKNLHDQSVKVIDQMFEMITTFPLPFKPLVIITHHLPSYKSIAPQYANQPANSCFASHNDDLIKKLAPILWIHGHTHTSFDYMIDGTRILCNPRGYYCENSKNFNSSLIIEV